LEAVRGVKTLSELSSTYEVHPTVIAQWKRQLLDGAAGVFGRANGVNGRSNEEIRAPLYEEIGRLKMELDWLKKSSKRSSRG
jgi:putative transposase